ncbi:hypothetical protein FIV42_01055 [Persicimonas caeni]|uniref:Uncharacterized protein n=1 Tax=Persicimonas caeni TaxID=2292766 RepID=A0A4Y6PM62_PERCE|nr:hypothetical protein [Persicimonas caeni]QDG49371.1 hypothetical protein FIV42_01055 [Persicimonas caeni]QED30592.1 hypothetical protein FRD00_01050 [Persicimonas caeni]
MRCWTDGNRSVFREGRRLDWVKDGVARSLDGFDEASSYGPFDALAVHPSKDVVWIGGDRCATWRVDMSTGERRRFDTTVADLCYVNEDEIWAVSGTDSSTGVSGSRRMLRFGDSAAAAPTEFELPATRPVRWPYGPAYAYGAAPADGQRLSPFEEIRITTTRHGICIASSGGFIWGFPNDAAPFGWQVAPVYQGWLVARLTDEGVLATALQNGRTGEIVLFDHDGCWYDAFDTQWRSISPAVPVVDGYLVGWDADSARVLAGHPMQTVIEGVVGARITDLEVADDGSFAVWVGPGERGSIRRKDGQWVSRRSEDIYDADVLRRVADPVVSLARWTWERIDAPSIPELSPAVPDPERTEELVETVRQARDTDSPATREKLLAEANRQFPWHPWKDEDLRKPKESVYWRLMRETAPPRPTRRQMRALAARLLDPDLSDFEHFHARACLSGSPHAEVDGRDVDDVLDSALRGPEEQVSISGRNYRVRRARLSGALDNSGVRWTAIVDLFDGPTIALETQALAPQSLTGAVESNAGKSTAEGTVGEDPVSRARLEVDRDGDHAHRLMGESRDPTMWFECTANFRGLVLPTCDHVADAVALAARHVDLTGWYAESIDGGVRLSVFEADLHHPMACENPAPDPAAHQLIDRLVVEDLLLIDRPFTDDELRTIQWALFAGGSVDERAELIEDALFELDAVAELFGTTDDFARVVAATLGELGRHD